MSSFYFTNNAFKNKHHILVIRIAFYVRKNVYKLTLGGATVFPNAEVVVPVEPGGVIIWQNLDFSGGNPLKVMEHGSCPVISGQKWISNKWIRYYDQMFQFPCLAE